MEVEPEEKLFQSLQTEDTGKDVKIDFVFSIFPIIISKPSETCHSAKLLSISRQSRLITQVILLEEHAYSCVHIVCLVLLLQMQPVVKS